MRNFKQVNPFIGLGTAVMLALAMLIPISLWAGSSPEFKETARSRKIFAEAPKTPEELFRVIKCFLDNPEMNGYKFVERISGIDRSHWGPENKGETAKGLKYKSYAILCPQCPYNQRAEVKKELPTSYFIRDIKIATANDQLVGVGASFRTGGHPPLSSMTFVMTPVIIREILGKPTRIYVSSPWPGGFSVGYYNLAYYYESKRYELKISFRAPGDESHELRVQRMNHTVEQMREEKRRRKELANHKDFLSLGFSVLAMY